MRHKLNAAASRATVTAWYQLSRQGVCQLLQNVECDSVFAQPHIEVNIVHWQV